MAGATNIGIQEPVGASQTAHLESHSFLQGTTLVHREGMVLGGTASGDIVQFASADPATNLIAPVVRALIANTSSLPLFITPATNVPITGTITVNPLTSGSKIQVEPAAAATFPISGNATAVVANASGPITTANPLPVLLQSSTATISIQGNSTAVLSNTSGNIASGNPLHVFLQDATGTVPVKGNVSAAISGNTTAVVANASGGITSGNPLHVYIQDATGTVPIKGNTTAVIGNASGVFTTGNPLPVLLQSSTATVTVQGNVSAVISGNATAVLSNTSGNITTGNPLAVYLQGSTAVVSIQGNATVAFTTGSTGRVELASGGVGGTSGNALWIQPTTTVPISGNTTAIIGNSSGVFSTANPLAVLLQSSTATVSVQGNVSAAVAGNVSAVISGNSTAVLSNTSGNITTANPLAVYLQGSTAVVTIQGNSSVVVTAQPGMAQINASGGSTIHLVGGMDGNTSNSTARALKVNASQELIITGAVGISGNSTAVLSNTSGNITTANPLAIFLQGSTATVTVQGNVSAVVTAQPGMGVINTTAGTSGLLMLGADGNTSNSTARYLQVNASQELIVKGTIVGNTSVVGNVSAVISGNSTAVLSNTSGNITTANPLAIFLQGSTATVSIQGNATAILTTGSKVQVEPVAGAVFGISGNTSISAAAALPVGLLMNQVYQGTTALVPQYANFAATASGLLSVVASVTGRIVVLAAQLTVFSSCSIRWFSSATNALTGLMPIGERSGFVLPFSPVGWFRTATGEALQLELASATGPLGGSIVYCVPTT